MVLKKYEQYKEPERRKILDEWVKKMEHQGHKGANFTQDQAKRIYDENNISQTGIDFNDFYVAINMIYSDFKPFFLKYNQINNNKAIAELTTMWLADEDIDGDKILKYALFVAEQ